MKILSNFRMFRGIWWKIFRSEDTHVAVRPKYTRQYNIIENVVMRVTLIRLTLFVITTGLSRKQYYRPSANAMRTIELSLVVIDFEYHFTKWRDSKYPTDNTKYHGTLSVNPYFRSVDRRRPGQLGQYRDCCSPGPPLNIKTVFSCIRFPF